MMNQVHTTSKFSICALNCEGFNRNSEYMHDVLSIQKPDVLCVQETWLLDSEIHKLNNVHSDYLAVAKSNVDSTSHLLHGRPNGDVCILFRKYI